MFHAPDCVKVDGWIFVDLTEMVDDSVGMTGANLCDRTGQKWPPANIPRAQTLNLEVCQATTQAFFQTANWWRIELLAWANFSCMSFPQWFPAMAMKHFAIENQVIFKRRHLSSNYMAIYTRAIGIWVSGWCIPCLIAFRIWPSYFGAFLKGPIAIESLRKCTCQLLTLVECYATTTTT